MAESVPARRVLVPSGSAPPVLRLPGRGAVVGALCGETMGTTWTVKVVVSPSLDKEWLRRRIEARLDRVIAEMSTWRPNSDISRFNRALAGTWHALPDDFAAVLSAALSLARDSDGAFDPTVGPAVALWGFGPDGPSGRAPSGSEVAEAQRRCDFRRLRFENGHALQTGDIGLDLSGIAKGFAVDAVVSDLAGLGFENLLVEIGGELRGVGVKPDGSPWWVELERPPGQEQLPETLIALHELAVATSGSYRRRHDIGGREVSHTLVPAAAEPIGNDVLSVSVIARTCTQADGLATALTVLGPCDGIAWAEARGIAALFTCVHGSDVVQRASRVLTAMGEAAPGAGAASS